MRLDLGCGANKREGFIGVDISAECGADIVHDLRITPWPFPDGSVDEVHCAHFFEHLTGSERIAFMDEMYRIMRPGATARVITPYWTSVGAIQDPTHQWPPVAEASYRYFNKAWRQRAGVPHYGINSDFDATFQLLLNPDWQKRAPQEQQFGVRFHVNVVQELAALLTRL